MFRFLIIWIILNVMNTFIVVSQDCGGNLPADPSGEIRNPDMDGNSKYDDNSNCVWTITAKSDKFIEIEFMYMELEEMDCAYDYVEIYDGKLGDSFMGRFCGFVTPESLMSSGNVVTIVFKTDALARYYGFGIIYFERDGMGGITICGPVRNDFVGTLVSNSDVLHGVSDDKIHCTWEIKALAYDKKIQIFFQEIAIQSTDNCQKDYVKVYDAKKVYGLFCGTESPPVITSTANYLFVEFKSDNRTGDDTFQALFAIIDGDLQCGAILTEPTGQISTPDRDKNGIYDYNIHCIWVLVAPANATLQFDITFFNIEYTRACHRDYLEFFELSFTPESSVGRFCGQSVPSTIISTKSVAFVEFFSDNSVVTVNSGGVTATYRHVYGNALCGPTHFFHLAGSFTSVNINMDGSSNVNCTWEIEVYEPDKLIELYIVLTSVDCSSDYIKIYDEFINYGKFCGENKTFNVISTFNKLNVSFFADGENDNRGFTAYYTMIDEDHQCGAILSSPTGTLRSVDRDNNGKYDRYLHCVWAIVAPEGRNIRLEFLEFALESSTDCNLDFLQLADGTLGILGYETRFCGSDAPPPTTTKTNILYVHFFSDGSVEHKGFLANYSFVQDIFTTTTNPTATTLVTTASVDDVTSKWSVSADVIMTSVDVTLNGSTNQFTNTKERHTAYFKTSETIIKFTSSSTPEGHSWPRDSTSFENRATEPMTATRNESKVEMTAITTDSGNITTVKMVSDINTISRLSAPKETSTAEVISQIGSSAALMLFSFFLSCMFQY